MSAGDALRCRYPDPPPKPTLYHGWRRVKKHGVWQKIDGTEKPTKGQCYESLMALSYLVGGEDEDWEFTILPAGEKPAFAFGGRNLAY